MGRVAISRRLYPCYQERACVTSREIEGDSCDYLSEKPVRFVDVTITFRGGKPWSVADPDALFIEPVLFTVFTISVL